MTTLVVSKSLGNTPPSSSSSLQSKSKTALFSEEPLNGLTDRIKTLINSSTLNSGDPVTRSLIQTAIQLNTTLQNVVNVYQKNVNANALLIGKSDDVYDRLKGLIEQLEQKDPSTFAAIQKSAVDIIATLPFADKQSRFTGIKPRYIPILANTTTIKVTMTGLFYFAKDAEYAPSCLIGTTYCPVNDSQGTEVAFDIPVAALLTPDQMSSTNRSYIYPQGVFNAPWQSGSVLSSKIDAIYPFWLGILPATPGKISLTYEISRTIEQSGVSTKTALETVDVEIKTLSFVPTSGWKYKFPPTVNIDLKQAYRGDIQTEMNVEGTQFTVNVTLMVGRIWFHLNWIEYQEIPNERTEEVSDLLWGTSRVFSPLEHETIKKIHLDAFDGNNYDLFTSSGEENPFIHIATQDGQAIISAVVPDENQINLIHAALLETDLVKRKEHTLVSQKKGLTQLKTFIEKNKATTGDKEKALETSLQNLDKEIKDLKEKKPTYASMEEALNGARNLAEQLLLLGKKKTHLENCQSEHKCTLTAHTKMEAIFNKLTTLALKTDSKPVKQTSNEQKEETKEKK